LVYLVFLAIVVTVFRALFFDSKEDDDDDDYVNDNRAKITVHLAGETKENRRNIEHRVVFFDKWSERHKVDKRTVKGIKNEGETVFLNLMKELMN